MFAGSIVADAPGTSPSAPHHNLPPQPHPIIGRESHLAAAQKQLVHANVRLLTLTGPPGVGKTRLAIELAAILLKDFEDGVWFVDLSSITDARLVQDAIVRQLACATSVAEHLARCSRIICAIARCSWF